MRQLETASRSLRPKSSDLTFVEHIFRVSENVSHEGGLLTSFTR